MVQSAVIDQSESNILNGFLAIFIKYFITDSVSLLFNWQVFMANQQILLFI